MTNIESLGVVLNDRMKHVTRASSRACIELGKINSDLSLSTDSFLGKIPKGDYMVDKQLKEYGGGDRVLVAWAGREPVVICVVTSS